MDTRVFRIYNLARGVFLSSKVTVVDCANEPLRVLKVLVSELGLDTVSGLWLFPLNAAPLIPRIFPFDLLYLDRDNRVVDLGEILPGVEFPPFRTEVASALVLARKTLQSTQTARGDRLLIGLKEEIEQQIGAWDTSVEANAINGKSSNGKSSGNGHRESTTLFRGEAAFSESVSAVLTSEFPLAATAAPKDGALVDQRTELAVDLVGERLADFFATSIAAKSQTDEAQISTPAETPVTITEAFLERPSITQAAAINGQHGFIEDMFSNWVDAPSSASAWSARNATVQGIKTEIPVPASVVPLFPGPATAVAHEENPDPVTRETLVAASTSVETLKNGPVSMAEPAHADKFAPAAVSDPVRTAIPQPPLATTFTVAQYGLWRVSMPATVSPILPPQGPFASSSTASVADAQPSKQGKTSANSSAAKTAKAPDSNVQAKGLKESEKISVSLSATKPAQEETFDSRAVDYRTQERQVSIPAAADTRAQLDAIASTIERQPDIPIGTAEPSRSARVAAVASEKLVIAAREVPAATETGNSPATAKRVPQKPVDSTATPTAKSAVPKQQGERRELTSISRSEVSLAQPSIDIRKPEQDEQPKISAQRADANGKAKEHPPSLRTRFKRWLNPVAPTNSDRRQAHRRYVPGMVAHYYTGGAPKPHDVADISMTGLYLLTEDRWMPDTMIQMTLQKPCAKGERKQSITVLSKIVRRGSDGVAAQFVMPESLDPQSHDVQPSQTTDRFSLARFL